VTFKKHKIRFSLGLCPEPHPLFHTPNRPGRSIPLAIPYFLDDYGASFLSPAVPHLELGETCSKELGEINAPPSTTLTTAVEVF